MKKINRKTRCYNSGKIGELGYLTVVKNFEKADKDIASMGFTPVNPVNNGLSPKRTWILHMIVDILMLATCGNIYLQTNWRSSRGAKIEYRFAKVMGLNIWFEENPCCEKTSIQ